jgi:hypothetical protein
MTGFATTDKKGPLYVPYVLLTVHLDNLNNENQLDALFILNLFHSQPLRF